MPKDMMEPQYAAREQPMEQEETENEESASALLPKSIFDGEVKPGDTITLKVDAVYSDEVECSVVPGPNREQRRLGPSADEELESMGEEEMD